MKMMRMVKVAAVVLAMGLAGGLIITSVLAEGPESRGTDPVAGAEQKAGSGSTAKVTNEGVECMRRMRDVTAAINEYAIHHDMHLPPDLGATSPYLKALRAKPGQTEGRWTDLTPIEKAQSYLCPAEAKGVGLPADVTEEWVNQHSSFVYLGDADIVMSKIGGDPGKIVVLYDRLVVGHADINRRIPVFFVDGHGEGVDRAEADRLIAESRKILEAARMPATNPAK